MISWLFLVRRALTGMVRSRASLAAENAFLRHQGASPTLAWLKQRIREATPFGSVARFLVHDNDGILGQFGRRRPGRSGRSYRSALRTPPRPPASRPSTPPPAHRNTPPSSTTGKPSWLGRPRKTRSATACPARPRRTSGHTCAAASWPTVPVYPRRRLRRRARLVAFSCKGRGVCPSPTPAAWWRWAPISPTTFCRPYPSAVGLLHAQADPASCE
jgi:hypothetical protein